MRKLYATKNCVKCGKEATTWTGHIHHEGEKNLDNSYTAGWCEDCYDKYGQDMNDPDGRPSCVGCLGEYEEWMEVRSDII